MVGVENVVLESSPLVDAYGAAVAQLLRPPTASSAVLLPSSHNGAGLPQPSGRKLGRATIPRAAGPRAGYLTFVAGRCFARSLITEA